MRGNPQKGTDKMEPNLNYIFNVIYSKNNNKTYTFCVYNLLYLHTVKKIR